MILEELMLDLMYYVPGNKKVKELSITAEMVKKPQSDSPNAVGESRLIDARF